MLLVARLLTGSCSAPRSALHTSAVLAARRWQAKNKEEFTSEFENPVREIAGLGAPGPERGLMYDSKPMRVRVKAGVSYHWCGCGLARTQQPFCDLACQNLSNRKILKGCSVHYIAPKSQEVWLCNCKQTSHPPFCDGTHRGEEVQTHRFDGNRQLWEPRKKTKL